MSTTISVPAALAGKVASVFGSTDDAIDVVETRAGIHLNEYSTIVWEADASTLTCTFVGASAVPILGYDRNDWTRSPTFWSDIIHPEDRDEATANCAICAGRRRGHNFSYRAIAASGEVHRFYNIVRVVHGPKGMATHLRGILFDVTDDPDALSEASPLMQIESQESEEPIEF